MKKTLMTRITVMCLAAVMVIFAAGCSMVSVDESKKRDQTVATVNGVDLTYAEYENLLNNYLYQYYGYTEEQYLALDDENLESIQGVVLDALVMEEVEYQYAVENGYELSEEELKAVEDSFNQEIADLESNYREILAMNGTYTEEEAETMVEEYMTYQLGEDFDWDEAFARVCKDQVVGNFENDLIAGIEITDEQIQEYYDGNVENQLLMLEQDASGESSMYGMLEYMGSDVYVYPEGTRRVQNLLIKIDDEASAEIESLRSAGDTAAADALRDEALLEIEDEANNVLAEVTANEVDDEGFAEFMDKYGEDTGMQDEENRIKGYVVHEYANYVPEFLDASFALTEVGEISGLVATDYGYHILRLVSFPDQKIPLDELYDDIKTTLTTTEQQSVISTKQAELKEAADITTYPDRVKIEGQ